MKVRTQSLIIEKLIDMSVVILGILIALGVNSCVKDRAHKADWESHKKLFMDSIVETRTSYKENLKNTVKKIELGEKAAQHLKNEKKVDTESLEKFLSKLTSLDLSSAVNSLFFKSFSQSNNPYFMENFERLILFDEFFSFEESAKIYADMYINQIVPNLLNFRKTSMKKDFFKTLNGMKETEYTLRYQMGFLTGIKQQYEKQIELADELLEELKKK